MSDNKVSNNSFNNAPSNYNLTIERKEIAPTSVA